MRFEKFKFLDVSGKEVEYICDESKLKDFYHKNLEAPYFLTQVFFKKEVLDKYYTKSSKYSIGDGYISEGNIWGISIDNNARDCIMVYLGDLGRLPYKEQQYWKWYNITNGDRSVVSFKRDFQAEFCSPTEPALFFKEKFKKFNKRWGEAFGWDLFRPLNKEDEHHIKTLKIPSNEQKEFDEVVLSLNKIIIDSLNTREIKQCNLNFEKKDQSISILERYLEQKHQFSSSQMFNFLRNLQKLRSKGSAHRKGSDYKEIYQKVDEGNLPKTFEKLLIKSIWMLNTIEKRILSKEFRVLDWKDCIEKDSVPSNIKIASKDYLEKGLYPIIDQGEKFVAGYTNDQTKIYPNGNEVIVFGDHTRRFKYINFPFCIGADGTRVIVPKKFLDTKFLYYQLKSLPLEDAGYSRHYKFLKRKKIVVPPLDTQKRIISILNKAEKLKERRKKANEDLDKLIQSVFYEMFGAEIKFEEFELKDICNTSSGGTPSRTKKEYWENGTIPWIKSGELNNDRIIKVDEFITEQGLKHSSTKYIEPETVLIAMYGATAGKSSISKIRATTNQAVCAINPKGKNLDKLYLLYWLRTNYQKIADMSFGGGQPNISQQVIRKLRISLPPIKLQNQFADFVKKIEALKEKQKKSTEDIEQLFNALMQRAFTHSP